MHDSVFLRTFALATLVSVAACGGDPSSATSRTDGGTSSDAPWRTLSQWYFPGCSDGGGGCLDGCAPRLLTVSDGLCDPSATQESVGCVPDDLATDCDGCYVETTTGVLVQTAVPPVTMAGLTLCTQHGRTVDQCSGPQPVCGDAG
jgi:hypothetical protein